MPIGNSNRPYCYCTFSYFNNFHQLSWALARNHKNMSNFCLLLSNTLQYLNFRLRYFHNWDVRMFRIVPLHETHPKFTQNMENLFDIKIVFLEIFIYIKEQSNLLHLFGPHRRNGWSWILWNQFPGAIGRNDTTKVGHFDVKNVQATFQNQYGEFVY